MSLIRQVWLLLLCTVLLALAGSATIHVLSMRATLQTQLRVKNSDNAAALALALSQQKGDRELMGLLMSAQFDTGFYRLIRFSSADGRELFKREATGLAQCAPAWFSRLVPIESDPGTAQVSDGWRALGSVTVISHASFAHDDLWRSSLESVALIAALGLLAGAFGTLVVRGIQRSLESTVQQAQALVDGHFVTVPEPQAPELQRVTRAMNTMVQRLKNLFEAHAAQVESLHQQAHCDALTGLANRSHFLGQVAALLDGEDAVKDGALVLLRLADLAEMNRSIGHDAADRAILAIAQALLVYPRHVDGCLLGRLNGSDFALWLPTARVAEETAHSLDEALRASLPAFGPRVSVNIGAVEIHRSTSVAQVMSVADLALAGAESRGAFAVDVLRVGVAGHVPLRGEHSWREQIGAALAQGRAHLAEFPVLDQSGRLIHLECPLRLQLEPGGAFEPAARWLPLAMRSRLTSAADTHAVSLALQGIRHDGYARCVNLAPASLADGAFVAALRKLLRKEPGAARSLSLELAEPAALERFELLQAFGRDLRPLGVRLGLEHAGERLAQIDRLFEAGLDYVKLDASVTRGVGDEAKRAEFVKSSVTLLHGLSLPVYAEGVVSEADLRSLWSCGIDGATGPWITEQRNMPVS